MPDSMWLEGQEIYGTFRVNVCDRSFNHAHLFFLKSISNFKTLVILLIKSSPSGKLSAYMFQDGLATYGHSEAI